MGNRKTYKALLIGVSDYTAEGLANLPVVTNDAICIRDTLINSCFIPESDIHILNGRVSRAQFDEEIANLCQGHTNVGILYFSGHGSASCNDAIVYFSDGKADSLKHAASQICKHVDSLLVIVDACHAGGLILPDNPETIAIDAPYGLGYVLFASCSQDEESFILPGKPTSIFTNLVQAALSSAYYRSEGLTSLAKAEDTLRKLVNRHNERYPKYIQHPIIRHNMTGTLLFENPNHIAYAPNTIELLSRPGFKIVEIGPCHSCPHQRNSAIIKLAESVTEKDLIEYLPIIINHVKQQRIYSNKKEEEFFEGKLVDTVFLYFASTEIDIVHQAYSHRACWQLNDNESFHWGRWIPEADCWLEKVNNHDALHHLVANNQIDDNAAWSEIQRQYRSIETLSKAIFQQIDDYLNQSIDETSFFESIDSIRHQLHTANNDASNIGFASRQFEPLINRLIGLIGDLDNIAIIYSQDGMNTRDEDNRQACLKTYKNMYLRDLKLFKDLLITLQRG